MPAFVAAPYCSGTGRLFTFFFVVIRHFFLCKQGVYCVVHLLRYLRAQPSPAQLLRRAADIMNTTLCIWSAGQAASRLFVCGAKTTVRLHIFEVCLPFALQRHWPTRHVLAAPLGTPPGTLSASRIGLMYTRIDPRHATSSLSEDVEA